MGKNLIKHLGTILLMALSTGASAQCLNINGDMETFATTPVAGNVWINDNLTNWSVSHGTPSINTTPDMQMWMWSYNGFGEGIFTDYSFTAGQTYQITYDLWRDDTSNPDSEFKVELTNGLTPWYGGNFTPLPTPTSQPLTTQPWVSTGVWVTITETFVPGAAYSQIWLYPDLAGAPTPWQAACIVDNICITEVIKDPCDVKPLFSVKYREECSINFSDITTIPTGLTVLETYWDFGDGTTATGSNVSHFYTSSGVYVVCMTVWVINEDGECCKIETCKEIEVAACDPCDWLERAIIETAGSNPITFTVSGLPSGMNSLLGYHWDFGDGTTGTGYPITHTYDRGGVYKVCLTLYYYNPELKACCSATVCLDVEVADVADARRPTTPVIESGINYEKDNVQVMQNVENLIISPNPNNGTFVIYTKNGDLINSITVYDQAGKVIFQQNSSNSGSRITLTLADIEAGVYVIVLNETDDLNRQFSKLVIK